MPGLVSRPGGQREWGAAARRARVGLTGLPAPRAGAGAETSAAQHPIQPAVARPGEGWRAFDTSDRSRVEVVDRAPFCAFESAPSGYNRYPLWP